VKLAIGIVEHAFTAINSISELPLYFTDPLG
jgi:hypothetical protein